MRDEKEAEHQLMDELIVELVEIDADAFGEIIQLLILASDNPEAPSEPLRIPFDGAVHKNTAPTRSVEVDTDPDNVL